ncbi:family 10 glycosylhydrolase [Thermoactinomyces sp. AMNI-1]|uniref:Family 10 glycosylhydrolase n=1 Tax=Thermoactinomyces mirandus TaxID=2756294 RepID=A0A7W1XQY4_9BACL|nr:family 10 glycosylhydrolase [Thermoactinomyces mirandus]
MLLFTIVLGTLPWVQADEAKKRDGIPFPDQPERREFRAVWISSVVNIDWPSDPHLSKDRQQAEFVNILEESKKMGLNAVIVQIRPTADALYPSKINPWSKYLTGEQGKSPGYDPLAFMIEEAHKRNLEFHAWFNPYRVSMDPHLENLVPEHPARKKPDWVVTYGGKLWYDPGLPAVRHHIIESIMEVVEQYDIDAVHFDDYFYPYPAGGHDFPDEKTYQDYGKNFADKGDWRRHNVNLLIHQLNKAIKEEKPWVKFGISPFGIWKNKSSDPTGSDTNGSESYYTVYADTRTWIREGWLDYVAPQIYWNIGFPPASYEKLLNWWSKETEGKSIHLYIGQAAYKVGNNIEAWDNPEELPNQIKLNRADPVARGSIFFSYKDLIANRLGIKDRITNDLYKEPALIPAMPWLDHKAPKKPILEKVTTANGDIHFKWKNRAGKDSAYFVIYRLSIAKGKPAPEKKLLVTIRNMNQISEYTLKNRDTKRNHDVYFMTAIDRLHNESPPSNPLTDSWK